MENLYNAVLSFKGEGSFTFSLPKYGELTIYTGRDIYIKGLTVVGVEALRQLKPLLLEHKLNGKPDGCYRVIDLTTLNNNVSKILNTSLSNPIQEIKSVADLKAEMIKSNGPIIEEVEGVEEPKSNIEESEISNLDLAKEDEEKPKIEKKINKSLKRNNRKKSK